MNRAVVILILLALVSFFLNLGGPSIYILDEAKNAGCAMEMQQRNDWIVPTFNNELRTDKPPLHYYFMRGAYSMFGVTPFAARFFSAVMGLLLIVAVYRLTKKYIRERAACYTSIILLCSIQVSIQFRLAVPDPYLITFLTASLLLFYEGFQSGKTSILLLSYLALALATLAKGPVAVIFFVSITGIFLLMTKSFSWKQLLRLKVPFGILLFLVITLPWYIAVGIETDGEWLQQFFFKHNIGRFTSTMEGHKSPPLISLLVVILGLMPFSFYSVQMLKAVWNAKKQNQLLLLALIAVAVVTMFFAFSRTFLPGYSAPAFPFFAILLGYYWDHFMDKKIVSTGSIISGFVAIMVSIAICIGLWKVTETELVQMNIEYSWVYGLVLLTGSTLALFFLYRKWLPGVFYAYTISWVVFIGLFFFKLFPAIDSHNPVTQSLPLLNQSSIAYYQTLNPAYVFALQKPLHKITTAEELQDFLNQPNTRVITDLRALRKIDSASYSVVFQQKDLFERSTTVIIEGKH